MARKTPHRYKSGDFVLPAGMKLPDLDWVGFAWVEHQDESYTHRNATISQHRLSTHLLGPGANIVQVNYADSPNVFTYRNGRPAKGHRSVTEWVGRNFLCMPDLGTLEHDPVLVDFTADGMKDRLLELHPKWFKDRPVVTLGDAIAYGDDDVEKMIVDHLHATLKSTPAGTGVHRPLADYLADALTGFTPSTASLLYGPTGGTTLADIQDSATAPNNVLNNTDTKTPKGTFTATTWADGAVVVYLMSGQEGDPSAAILGRVEMPVRSDGFLRAFKGGGTGGGDRLVVVDDLQGIFQQMM